MKNNLIRICAAVTAFTFFSAVADIPDNPDLDTKSCTSISTAGEYSFCDCYDYRAQRGCQLTGAPTDCSNLTFLLTNAEGFYEREGEDATAFCNDPYVKLYTPQVWQQYCVEDTTTAVSSTVHWCLDSIHLPNAA